MELEHLLQMTTFFMVLQMVCMSTAYLIEQMIGGAAVRTFVRNLASVVVTFGPMTLLLYILSEVSKLS